MNEQSIIGYIEYDGHTEPFRLKDLPDAMNWVAVNGGHVFWTGEKE